MRRFPGAFGLLAGAILAVGCAGEPIEGDWAATSGACADERKDSFSIDGDLLGAGEFVLACSAGTQEALVCAAHLYASNSSREDLWSLEAQFGYCQAVAEDIGRRFRECASRSDDEMTCCNPDGTGCVAFLRVGD